mmetsp:Transcript_33309/g.59618  ORF Transcript_33309/g.59618 Transcript_33309/m.59618 type:complete len:296 (-) Transcript_33309:1362-2249(-)
MPISTLWASTMVGTPLRRTMCVATISCPSRRYLLTMSGCRPVAWTPGRVPGATDCFPTAAMSFSHFIPPPSSSLSLSSHKGFPAGFFLLVFRSRSRRLPPPRAVSVPVSVPVSLPRDPGRLPPTRLPEPGRLGLSPTRLPDPGRMMPEEGLEWLVAMGIPSCGMLRTPGAASSGTWPVLPLGRGTRTRCMSEFRASVHGSAWSRSKPFVLGAPRVSGSQSPSCRCGRRLGRSGPAEPARGPEPPLPLLLLWLSPWEPAFRWVRRNFFPSPTGEPPLGGLARVGRASWSSSSSDVS